ncbi:MAG: flavodoxin family protein [Deltaproteobacteria bacterium]|jgi:multimeric flavodoxin WrbA|nr:flavodoxin family protein [Deltaproteobacteria bacterium]
MAENTEKLVLGVNGGPRKGWNTDLLLKEILKGAEAEGAETELIDLYKLNFRGCVSCFSCKRVESHRNGKCALKDDLSPVLTRLEKATGLAMGSPIYLSDVTGALRSFLERYIFMNIVYSAEDPPVLERGPAMALVYTMNVTYDTAVGMRYDVMFKAHQKILSALKPPFIETLYSCDTLQFDDYSSYYAPRFDSENKKRRRRDDFPLELKKAYEIGRLLGKYEKSPLIYKP